MSDHPYWSEDGDADTVPLAGRPQDLPPRPAASRRLRTRWAVSSLRGHLPTTTRGWLIALGALPATAILMLIVLATVAGHGSNEPATPAQHAARVSHPRGASREARRNPLPAPHSRSSRNSHRPRLAARQRAAHDSAPPEPQQVATTPPPVPTPSSPSAARATTTVAATIATTPSAALPTTTAAAPATTTTPEGDRGGGCPPPVGYEC